MRSAAILIVLTSLAVVPAACSRSQPAATPQPALPAQRAPATARSVTLPARSPRSPVPAPAKATPPPRATPTPAPVIPRLPPNAAPHILSVAVNKTTVSSGDRVSGTVLTSSNVASVEVRIGGYGVALNKVGVGRFTLAYTVGDIPFFVHGTYQMQVIARNARGDATQTSLPIEVR